MMSFSCSALQPRATLTPLFSGKYRTSSDRTFQAFARFSRRRSTPVSMLTVRCDAPFPRLPFSSRDRWNVAISSALMRITGRSPKKRFSGRNRCSSIWRVRADTWPLRSSRNTFTASLKGFRAKSRPRQRRALPLENVFDSLLLQTQGLPLVARVECFAVSNPVDCHVHVPEVAALVDHDFFAPFFFSAHFPVVFPAVLAVAVALGACFFLLPLGRPPFFPHSASCSLV